MRVLLFSVPLLSMACFEIKLDGGGLGDDSGDGSETGDTDTDLPEGPAVIRGTVTASLYTTGASGELEDLSWTDATGDVYAYGNIFVAAYAMDSVTDSEVYLDTFVIEAPSTTGDAYELTVEEPQEYEEIYVYAAMDYAGDGILGTWEPQAVYPGSLELAPLEEVEVNLEITTPWLTGGGGGPATVGASGNATLNYAYAGERCFAMFYDWQNSGPWYYSSFYGTNQGDGTATGTFSVAVAQNYGASRLMGACDSNQNTLIDPQDRWGEAVDAGISANPMVIAEADFSEITLEIPFDGSRSTTTPFVLLEGAATSPVDFSTYAGGTLHIVAMRTPRSGDIDVTDFALAYDTVAISGAELTGAAIPYRFVVPPHKTVYLWAYLDTDGDGIANEGGEPLGSSGTYGRTEVTTVNQADLNINVQPFLDE